MQAPTDKPAAQSKNIKRMAIFIVAFAILVFGVTFVAQFLSNPVQSERPPTVPEAQLAHDPSPGIWNADSEKPQTIEKDPNDPAADVKEFEWEQPGQFCFWVDNTLKEVQDTVLMGLHAKNCTCTKVEWCSAPPGVKDLPALQRTKRADDPQLRWQALEKVEDQDDARTREQKGVKVPRGEGGWVRLNWKSPDRPAVNAGVDGRRLKAELWTKTSKGMGSPISLEINALYGDPVQAISQESEKDPQTADNVARVGDLQPNEERAVTFLCFSPTRNFKLTPPAQPLVAFGTPVPLTDAERKEFVKTFQRHVKDAYHFTVRVKGPHMGPFRRSIILSSEPAASPVTGVVRGAVKGPVRVITGADEERDVILLGKFSAKEGSGDRTVRLEANPELGMGLKLELDRERTPAFLDIEPPRRAEGADAASNNWDLVVKVPPGKRVGTFGDERDTTDCAIYLRLIQPGKPPQTIRIPITGEAVQ